VYHVPGPRGISPGYFLPQKGVVSMFFSGAGRQPEKKRKKMGLGEETIQSVSGDKRLQ